MSAADTPQNPNAESMIPVLRQTGVFSRLPARVLVLLVLALLPLLLLTMLLTLDAGWQQDYLLVYVAALLIVLCLTVGIVWIGVERVLTRQINHLVDHAQRLADGQLSARLNLESFNAPDELAKLAQSMNQLAATLETRQTEFERTKYESQVRIRDRTSELGFLLEINKALTTSLDYYVSFPIIARLMIPTIADCCWIHVMDAADPKTDLNLETQPLELIAVAHAKAETQADCERIIRQQPFYPKILPPSIRYQRTEIYAHQDLKRYYDSLEVEPDVLQALQAVGIHSVMTVPLFLRGKVSGMMTLVFMGSDRRHGFQHQVLAQDVAAQAAVAIENSRLYQQARSQEEALRQLNAELEQRVYERTAQLTAVNRELEAFSYSVSHDLRAPLRAIDGFSQALLEDYSAALDEQGQDYLRRVRAATQRMGDLIDDILALSRVTRQEIDYKTVDLSQLAHDIIELFRHSEPQRHVECTIADDLVTQGDERLLAILLQNLIGNAWKFTSKRELAIIEIGKTEYDGQMFFFVRDNGAGFDNANAERLFGAFQRLHHAQDFEGTGIGLATAQRIINRHGGRIFARGEVGHGAVFYFALNLR